MQQGVLEEPLPRATFDRIFKAVLQQSGYFGKATVHAIRRYLAKKVNGTPLYMDRSQALLTDRAERYTEVERSQHITQTDPRVYGQSYVANTSSVDGKGAFLDEPAQHNHVSYFQSFAKFCEKGLPTCLPAEREAAVKQDPGLLALENRATHLKRDGVSPPDVRAAKNKARTYRYSLMSKALAQYQHEWVRERRDWKVLTRGKGRLESDATSDLLETMSLILPERGRLAKAMVSQEEASDESHRQTMRDLYSLISRDYSVVYRPGEEPVDGLCPVGGCDVEMDR